MSITCQTIARTTWAHVAPYSICTHQITAVYTLSTFVNIWRNSWCYILWQTKQRINCVHHTITSMAIISCYAIPDTARAVVASNSVGTNLITTICTFSTFIDIYTHDQVIYIKNQVPVCPWTYHCTFVHHLPEDSQNCKSMCNFRQCLCKVEHTYLYLQHIHQCQCNFVCCLQDDSQSHRSTSSYQSRWHRSDHKDVRLQHIHWYLDVMINIMNSM